MKKIKQKLFKGFAITALATGLISAGSAMADPVSGAALVAVVQNGFNQTSLNSRAINQSINNIAGFFSTQNISNAFPNVAAYFTQLQQLKPKAAVISKATAQTLSQYKPLLSDDQAKAVDCSNNQCQNLGLLNYTGTYTNAQQLQAEQLLQNLNNPAANGAIVLTPKILSEAQQGNSQAQLLVALSQYTDTLQSLPMAVYAKQYATHVSLDDQNDSISSVQTALNNSFSSISLTKEISKTNLLSMIGMELVEANNYLHSISDSLQSLRENNLLQAANLQNTTIEIRLLAKSLYGENNTANQVTTASNKAESDAKEQEKKDKDKK